MSKYFNETQKTEEFFAQLSVAKRQDVDSIIKDLRGASATAELPEVELIPEAHAAVAPPALPLPPEPPVAVAPAVVSVPTEPPATVAPPAVSAAPEAPAPAAQTASEIALTASPRVLSGEGANHYAMEAYRALRTRLMRLQAAKGLHSMVVSSAVPGEGKTLTTINLGLCYAHLHETPVLIIDADLRTRQLSQFLKNADRPGLTELLLGEVRDEEVIQRTAHANLHILPAGLAASSPPELFTGSAWSDFLSRCKNKFQVILVDAPPVRPLADFELICAGCDAFLMIVRAGQTQRQQLQQLVGQIDTKKLIGVVLNSAASFSPKGYYYSKYVAKEA